MSTTWKMCAIDSKGNGPENVHGLKQYLSKGAQENLGLCSVLRRKMKVGNGAL